MSRTSPDGTYLLTAAGDVLCASGPGTSLLGYQPEEVKGRSALDFIHSDDHEQSRDAFRSALAAPNAYPQFKVRVRRKDGEWCPFESTVANYLETECLHAVMVTCWHAAPAGDSAEALQMEDFANAVAHNLRQPLRTISMFTELLLRRTELDEHGRDLARNIVDGIDRTATLLDGLQAFAMHGCDEPLRPVDVNRVVAEVVRDLGHALTSSGASVTSDLLPVVRGRANDLSRMLQNLVMNAVRYRGPAPPHIHISAEAAGDVWIISVQDNGVGIAAEYRERIFRPFERLHGPSIPGVGIGLSICRKVAESMGGKIWVTDSPDAGATFRFTTSAVGAELHSGNGDGPIATAAGARAQGG